MWIFRPSNFHRKKFVEITWAFRPAKLQRKKYVETKWIFRPSKLHRQSTRKWRGNLSKFGLRRIDVISTLNGRGFDVVCPLGTFKHSHFYYNKTLVLAGGKRFHRWLFNTVLQKNKNKCGRRIGRKIYWLVFLLPLPLSLRFITISIS